MSELEQKELKDKILKGIALAYKKLVEQKKKEDGELVFANPNGEIIRVKAKDLK